jgi:integrase
MIGIKHSGGRKRHGRAQRRDCEGLGGRGLFFSEPKTQRSRRGVALSRETAAVLAQHRRRQLESRLNLGPAYEDHDLVFADPLGRPVPPYRLSQRFARVAKAAGVAPLRFHDLRHTSATLLLKAGVHPKVVSERLGHAGVSITLDTYSHVLPGLQEEAADLMDSYLKTAAREVGQQMVCNC